MSRFQAKVTGLSPRQGQPGTKVTIRGENLGTNSKDLIALYICNVNCIMTTEWISQSKLVCKIGPCRGKGEVIVVTRSGGKGISTVTFVGISQITGPMTESAVWVEENQTLEPIASSFSSFSSTATPIQEILGLDETSSFGRITEEQLENMFDKGSDSSIKDNFIPPRFLLQNYNSASFEDLQKCLNYIQTKSETTLEGPIVFVKSNIAAFMDCQDALAVIHGNLIKEEKGNIDKSSSEKLKFTLTNANKTALMVFNDVLKRKDKADSTRNALSVLNRYKFLFSLPRIMDKNIQKGEYEVVINDYVKAKLLFEDICDSNIFQKVYGELENKALKLKDILEILLKKPDLSLEDRKQNLKFLMQLINKGDPAWNYIVNYQQFIIQHIKDCNVEIIEDSHLQPTKIRYIDNLINILNDTLPDLWHIGQSYLKGALFNVTDTLIPVRKKRNEEFQNLISEVLYIFCYLIKDVFGLTLSSILNEIEQIKVAQTILWPNDQEDCIPAWIPYSLRNLRSTYALLNGLDLETSVLHHFDTLITELRLYCISLLLNQATEDIKILYQHKKWTLSFTSEGAQTPLPMLFENTIIQTLQLLKEVSLETWDCELDAKFASFKSEVQVHVSGLFKAFSDCLEFLAFTYHSGDTKDKAKEKCIREQDLNERFSTLPSRIDDLLWEKRILAVLNQCEFTSKYIIPKIKDLFKLNGYPGMDMVAKNVLEAYDELDEKLCETYLEQRCDPIVCNLEQGMYAGNFDWKDEEMCTGIRSYIREALIRLSAIHSEIYIFSPCLLQRIMKKVLNSFVEEISRLFGCISSYSEDGALQAKLEIMTLQKFIKSPDSSLRYAFDELLSKIPLKTSAAELKFIQEKIDVFSRTMKFQLISLDPHYP